MVTNTRRHCRSRSGLLSLLALLSGLSAGLLYADTAVAPPPAQPTAVAQPAQPTAAAQSAQPTDATQPAQPSDRSQPTEANGTPRAAPPVGKSAPEHVVITADRIQGKSEDGDSTVTTYVNATITHADGQFSADTIVDRALKKNHIFTCTCDPSSTRQPTYTDPETTVSAEKVTAYSSSRRAVFNKDVKLVENPKESTTAATDPKKIAAQPTTITADKLEYNYRDKVGEFTDNVTVVVTPRHPDDKGTAINKALTSDPSTLTADKLHYDGKHKHTVASGNVEIVQKARTVWADTADYFQDEDKVVLSGNVRIKNTGEEELKSLENADTVTVLLHDDWVDITAKPGTKVTMTLEVSDDEDSATSNSTTNNQSMSEKPAKGRAKK